MNHVGDLPGVVRRYFPVANYRPGFADGAEFAARLNNRIIARCGRCGRWRGVSEGCRPRGPVGLRGSPVRRLCDESYCSTIYLGKTLQADTSCEKGSGRRYPTAGIQGSFQMGFSGVVNITHSLIKIGMTFSRFPVKAAKLRSNTGNFAGTAG